MSGIGPFGNQSSIDTNPAYWREYTNLQHIKHSLIHEYLNGWLPKLGFWAGEILYLDTHAGRGRHLDGQLGSPLIALHTLLKHASRERMLSKCEIGFHFIETDINNAKTLEHEIASLGELPNGIRTEVKPGDCFQVLQKTIDNWRQSKSGPTPAFVFVDPYGFKVPGSILRELMSFPRVELFINVIWRELDMALHLPDQMKAPLDLVFDGPEWRTEISSDDFDERADQAVNILRQMTGAKWATYIRMLGDNNATRYFLLHLSNHDAGRDLMKDCMWAVCPDGGFYARKSDDPNQEYLITPTPDLTPLRNWVITKLRPGAKRWQELFRDLRSEIWREPHLNKVIREMRNSGSLEPTPGSYSGKFLPSNDPILRLTS